MTAPSATVQEKKSLPLPDFEPEQARIKRAELKKMRILATSMLVVAAVIFITCHVLQRYYDWTWLGFVRAAAEAGMVGGLADWFAVTALFRHPLHLPIPHTAIIRNEKDRIGASMATFVGDNFLNPDLVGEKIEKARLPERVGRWLAEEENAAKVSGELETVVKGVLDVLEDDEVLELISRTLEKQLGDRIIAPQIGAYLEKILETGKEEKAIQFLADKAQQWAVYAGPTVENIVKRDAPVWSPGFVNYLVGSRIHRELIDWTSKVSHDPEHAARKAAINWLHTMADDLQHDEETIERVEEIKNNILAREATSDVTRNTWERLKAMIIDTSSDPDSLLRRKAHHAVMNMGHRIATNEETQDIITERVVAAAKHVAANYAPEITGIISDTVERWDAAEASDKIEVLVGKDLQFIRMNGTIVGSLAGLAIYTLAFFILGM
ncbi:MAG: DUF445 family protein [Lawsonella sp.]